MTYGREHVVEPRALHACRKDAPMTDKYECEGAETHPAPPPPTCGTIDGTSFTLAASFNVLSEGRWRTAGPSKSTSL